MAKGQTRTAAVLKKYEADLLDDWTKQLTAGSGKEGRIGEKELRGQAKEFLSLLQHAAQGDLADTSRPEWLALNDFLEEVSRSRVLLGFTPDQTANFLFSFKKPLFARLRKEFGDDAEVLADETWAASEMIDRMGMVTIRAFQKTREDVINRQQHELLDLSTRVVKFVGRNFGPPHDRDPRQRPHADRDGIVAAENRGERLGDCHHRHHGRSDGRHPRGAAFAKNRYRDPLNGGGLHYERRAPANRSNDCPLGR